VHGVLGASAAPADEHLGRALGAAAPVSRRASETASKTPPTTSTTLPPTSTRSPTANEFDESLPSASATWRSSMTARSPERQGSWRRARRRRLQVRHPLALEPEDHGIREETFVEHEGLDLVTLSATRGRRRVTAGIGDDPPRRAS
jgi:hypothetical protein